MVNLMTTSRKDDLESLIYILCYLYTGTLPIIEFINADISNINMSQFLAEVLKYRVINVEKCQARIKQLLPENLLPAFHYVLNLSHDAKPDYNLIKLWMACSDEDERSIFSTKLVIKNERMAKDILYEHSFKDIRLRQGNNVQGQQNNQGFVKNKKSDGPLEIKAKIKDLNKSYEFDTDCNELQNNDKPIEVNYRKVDAEKARK
jgi:hypothetical protein